EGSAWTALCFGRTVRLTGQYQFTGLPIDAERGSLTAEDNVFREVYGVRNGVKVVYYLRSPIRIWHVNGATTVRDNVVEQAQQGVLIECRLGVEAGCDTGATRLTGNTFGGQVRDLSGVMRQVNTTAGALVFSGVRSAPSLSDNGFAMLPAPVAVFPGGVLGSPRYALAFNRVVAAPPAAAPLDLRPARPATDPDLSFAGAFRR